MLSRIYRAMPYTRMLARFNSSLLERIKSNEQGIYEPAVQEEKELDLNKKYISEINPTMVSFYGFKGEPDKMHLYEEAYVHQNNLPLFK